MDAADRKHRIRAVNKEIVQLQVQLTHKQWQLWSLEQGCPHSTTEPVKDLRGFPELAQRADGSEVRACRICDNYINEQGDIIR